MRYTVYEINNPKNQGLETLIILGSPATNGGLPSTILKSRLDTALAYLQKNTVQKIIVTGKAVYNQFEEAEVQREYLIKNGILDNIIIKENNSASTTDNALYVYRLAKQLNLKDIVVVTSHYHRERAQYIFSHYFDSYKIVTSVPGIFSVVKNMPYYLWDKYCLYRTKQGDDRLQRK
jgi:vancomycin permeability regulator SanA